ncbi:MAG: type II toxin-antitoxin system RelE/ParE family toxin [Thermotogota bacterium]
MSSSQKYEVIYLPAAKKDLNEIISYIQIEAPEAALNFLDKLDENILQLKDFPYKGKKPDDENLNSKGYQILVIGSYLVFYVVFEKEKIVEIRRIIHGKRKYKFLL